MALVDSARVRMIGRLAVVKQDVSQNRLFPQCECSV
jgi:hypothetical protein